MTQSHPFDDAVRSFLVREARKAGDPMEFWCSMMNHAKGNIESILTAFTMAGISKFDIVRAYNQLIK